MARKTGDRTRAQEPRDQCQIDLGPQCRRTKKLHGLGYLECTRSDEFIEQVEGGCQTGDISGNISQSPHTRSLEAVLRNGISNIINSIVWHLKLVAVCINKVSEAFILYIVQR